MREGQCPIGLRPRTTRPWKRSSGHPISGDHRRPRRSCRPWLAAATAASVTGPRRTHSCVTRTIASLSASPPQCRWPRPLSSGVVPVSVPLTSAQPTDAGERPDSGAPSGGARRIREAASQGGAAAERTGRRPGSGRPLTAPSSAGLATPERCSGAAARPIDRRHSTVFTGRPPRRRRPPPRRRPPRPRPPRPTSTTTTTAPPVAHGATGNGHGNGDGGNGRASGNGRRGNGAGPVSGNGTAVPAGGNGGRRREPATARRSAGVGGHGPESRRRTASGPTRPASATPAWEPRARRPLRPPCAPAAGALRRRLNGGRDRGW